MGKLIDLTGQRFGRLTIMSRAPDHIQSNGRHDVQWYCKCDCGNTDIVIARTDQLRLGRKRSCGCLAREIAFLTHKKYNEYDLTGEYGIGYTQNGEEFWFDLEDYDKIRNYCRYYDKHGYVVANTSDKKNIKLHRLVMDAEDATTVDHMTHPYLDANKRDNRKCNLRPATFSQQIMNTGLRKDNMTGYKGVYFDKQSGKFQTSITKDGVRYRFCGFDTAEEAAKKHDAIEEKLFREYRYTANN